MGAFADQFYFLADERSRLGRDRLAFLLVTAGFLDGALSGHAFLSEISA